MIWLSEAEKKSRRERSYTDEERSKITHTPITRDCFDVDYDAMSSEELADYDTMIKSLEWKRSRIAGSMGNSVDIRFNILITSLPAEYNVVRF
jgi:hypothetical protein